MVGFLQSPTAEAAEEEKEDLKFQPSSNSKKPSTPSDPLELCLPELEDISTFFPDSFLDFDYINGCFMEGNPELSAVSNMTDLGGNPVGLPSVGGELGVSRGSFAVGCDGVHVKVEVDEKKETGVVERSCEKINESEGLLIEEKLGKVSLEGNSDGNVGGANESAIKIDENENSEDDSDSDVDSEDESSSSSSSSSGDDDHEEDEENGGMSGEKKAKEVHKNRDLEEGEIMFSDDDADEMVGWGDDENDDGPSGPITSKNELTVLPPVPPVNVMLEPHHQTLPVGVILSIIGAQVIVEGVEKHSPLKDGSILWITERRLPLGIIDEIFGPVKNPYYVIRFNSESEVPTGIQQGTSISFVQEFSDHILNEKSLYQKGYDASGEHDEELSDQLEFSDDEKEAEYKRSLKIKKRGKNESKTNSGPKRKEKWHQKNAQSEDKSKEQKWSPVNQENYSGSSGHRQGSPHAPGFGPPIGICSNNNNNNNNLFPRPQEQQQQQQSLGLPPNGMLWMQQNPTPFQLYQTPLQTSAPVPGLPLNFNQLAGQPNFGVGPTWPATIDQNLLLSLQFAMGLQGQQLMQAQGSQIGFNPHAPAAPPVNLENNHNFNQGRGGGGRRGGGHHRGRGRFSGTRGRFQSR